jgi:xanthine/uracil permease
MSQRNLLILALSLSFGIGLSLLPEVVTHIPDFGIKFKLLLTTGLIPAGFLAFILNATLPKK